MLALGAGKGWVEELEKGLWDRFVLYFASGVYAASMVSRGIRGGGNGSVLDTGFSFATELGSLFGRQGVQIGSHL